ncbi:LysE family translocator [Neptuniibacter sp. UBA847]|uniref:LysE family translocator n=1 Tax=Neptuniibacter sp. UBA847 TaxID=1946977 RepID=UPI000C66901B|nr:LysE family translocator [Neptuniibacter sp. UBA847]MAY42626.1 threonine transporter RhtB [Oceanospirillaceae bacterium]|tara:strand:- start:3542 stop:4168 length:627 start_codon:yes stop_codon:yes gene_type:complete
MLAYETVIAFVVASTLLSLAPGPDNIFVLMQSVLHGRRAGIVVTLGLCTGLLGHTLAVTLGVSAIFQVSTWAFTALKLIGAAYLIYLAWGAFKASAEELPLTEQPVLSRWSLYKRGILMSSTNPKLAIFFMAFLPQFADPDRGEISFQLMQLGGLFLLVGFVVMSLFALLSGTIKSWLRDSERGQSVINKLAGTVFLGLALKLLMTER